MRLSRQLTIQRSESFNWQKSGSSEHTPDKVHDGDNNTWYTVKDGKVSGNFLKLYLSETFSITKIEITSRKSSKYITRMNNTEASVFLPLWRIEGMLKYLAAEKLWVRTSVTDLISF